MTTFKKYLIAALAAVSLLVAVFYAGRRSVKITTIEVATKIDQSKTAATFDQKAFMTEVTKSINEQFAKFSAEQFAKQQKNVRRESSTIKHPDGTVETKTTTTDLSTAESGSKTSGESGSKTTTDTALTAGASSSGTLLDEKLHIDQTFKKTEPATAGGPSWAFGVGASYQVYPFALRNPLPAPLGTTVVSAHLDHAITGPLWLGLWGTTALEAGVTLQLLWTW